MTAAYPDTEQYSFARNPVHRTWRVVSGCSCKDWTAYCARTGSEFTDEVLAQLSPHTTCPAMRKLRVYAIG